MSHQSDDWLVDTLLQWCENRECVYSGMAPQAPDTCIYGDYEGLLDTGLRCWDIPVQRPVDVLRAALPGRVLPDVRLPQEPHQTRYLLRTQHVDLDVFSMQTSYPFSTEKPRADVTWIPNRGISGLTALRHQFSLTFDMVKCRLQEIITHESTS